jgi:hypothetical protein
VATESQPSRMQISKYVAWPGFELETLPHDQLAPWTARPMDSLPHEQSVPWTARPMDNSPHGQLAPRPTYPMVGCLVILMIPPVLNTQRMYTVKKIPKSA